MADDAALLLANVVLVVEFDISSLLVGAASTSFACELMLDDDDDG